MRQLRPPLSRFEVQFNVGPDRLTFTTMADSAKKAVSNCVYQLSQKLGVIVTNIHGRIRRGEIQYTVKPL